MLSRTNLSFSPKNVESKSSLVFFSCYRDMKMQVRLCTRESFLLISSLTCIPSDSVHHLHNICGTHCFCKHGEFYMDLHFLKERSVCISCCAPSVCIPLLSCYVFIKIQAETQNIQHSHCMCRLLFGPHQSSSSFHKLVPASKDECPWIQGKKKNSPFGPSVKHCVSLSPHPHQ